MKRFAVLRHFAATALLACGLAGALLSGSTGLSASAEAMPAFTAQPQLSAAAHCATTLPKSARAFAQAMNRLPYGGDASLSVKLHSGRVAWIYGDTMLRGGAMAHSTAVMQNGGCFTTPRQQFLPNDRNGTYWWPTAAATLPSGTVLITATDGYHGHVRGALAVERNGRLAFDRWLSYWPQTVQGHPAWLAGLLVDGATLRVYGTRLTGGKYVFGKELWLSSVPLSGLSSGRGWSLGKAPIMSVNPHGVDTAVAPYKDARGYHLITISDGVLSKGPLVSLDSPTPSGPFTVRTLLTYNRAHQWRYNAAVHPEARLADGKILVTINNNWPWADKGKHPLSSYQPSYFEIAD